ncbi:hypothetical protein [Streptomyces flavofungini]|uniref:Lipoprotein n=1 Tax=Streptomyces flavofungini TaxID=68200 RepID=A0ABS0X9B9_9ACTN|nr:hypothetical protein [Streptomyces flavofungini]MBJ3809802.1 hypothetical protein [Streptomyces flavofungini]GHC80826.1 hypothetical protein GCM10010349_63570 [Streptomyces flavofungini]
MIRSVRTAAAVALAVSLTAVACTSEKKDGGSPSSAEARSAPLRKLPGIRVSGHVIDELEVGTREVKRRPVAEVRLGLDRLVPYVEPTACGLLVTGAKGGTSGLTSGWPEDEGEDSPDFPGGPYRSGSFSQGERGAPFAQLWCSRRAVVIAYDAKEHRRASGVRGAVSVVRVREGRTVHLVVGPERTRTEIAAALASGRTP